ncbi:MAG TPA: sugar transferase [Candidatus Limnocylindrales bacterium]|nr:sugar transferase [Candidatus Limnocylindrales bacterium]
MKNNAALVYALLLIVGDFLALLAAFSAAYILRVKYDPRPLIEQIPALTYFFAVATVLPLWVLMHAFIGLYSQHIYERRFAEMGRLLVGAFLGILVVVGYDFVTNKGLFPARLVPVYGLAIGFGFLVLFRSLARLVRRSLYSFGIGISNVLIVGDTSASEQIAEAISNTPKTGLRVLALVADTSEKFQTYAGFDDAIFRIRRPIHSIIQTELYGNQEKNNAILNYAQHNHVAYRFVPGNTDLFVGNITVELFAGLPMIAVHQTALIGWGRIVKRLFDIVASLLLLVISSPLWVLASLGILLFDPRGGIFFKQTRLTRFNREFQCYKFRTLKKKYNGMLPEEGFEVMGKPELAKTFRENGDYLPNDPRMSKIGLILRQTSLDELPQLINVLKGDLSLVGPRALVPRELSVYEKRHTILSVKSGLTGLAQVSGRKDISFDERRKLDLYYVQNWSFWSDITILLKTVRMVLTGSGSR